jgi:hypothetical protein
MNYSPHSLYFILHQYKVFHLNKMKERMSSIVSSLTTVCLDEIYYMLLTT